MAKDIKFNIKLTVDGKEQVVTASTNIKGLAQQLGIARTRSEKFTVSMLKWNQSTQAIQNAYSSFQQLTSVMKEMTSAYEVQEVAETKLSSVMKQRMNASSSDIESIKKLASEQQKLGVVGDEVSLSGIQQVATFVNQKSTLETLMPALNNLIAHEGGLNATTEQATTLGNLLGKAMQGQTGVLRRVGVTFTDAQARVMKFGSESEKAAMLAQIVADNYGNVNEALAKTDSGKVKQMTNEFGDMKEAIGKALAAYMPMIEKMSEIGFAVSGVAVMVTSLGSLAKMLGVAKLATIAYTATVKFTKTAMVSLTVATGSATVAATALAAAYTMGLSLAITGVATLISNLCSSEDDAAKTTGEMSDAAQKAKDRQDELNTTMTNASSEISIMITRLKDFNGSKTDEQKLIKDCNDKYGDAMGYYGSVSDWYAVLTANSKTYCDQLVNEAKMRQLANQAADAEQNAHDIKYNKDGSLKYYKTKGAPKIVKDENASPVSKLLGTDYKVEYGQSDKSKAEGQRNQKLREANSLKQQMVAVNKSIMSQEAKMRQPVKGTHQLASAPTYPASAKTDKPKKTSAKTDKPDKIDTPKPDNTVTELNLDEIKTYNQLNEQISLYQDKLNNATEGQRPAIQKHIEDLNGIKDKWDEALNSAETYKPGDISTLNTGADIDKAIQFYSEQQQNEDGDHIEETQKKIDALTEKKHNLYIGIDLISMNKEIKEINKLSGKEYKLKISGMNIDDIKSKIEELNDLLTSSEVTDKQKTTIKSIIEQYKKYGKEVDKTNKKTEELDGISNAASSVNDLANSMTNLFEGSKAMAASMAVVSLAASMSQLIASMVRKADEGTIGPWDWIAAVAAGTAAVVSTAAQFKSIGVFAKGGVVSGPTLAMVGEYAGASNNPEIIAPLDKLRNMIEPQSYGGGNFRFEIEGRKLVGVLANETRISSKSGKRTNIKI